MAKKWIKAAKADADKKDSKSATKMADMKKSSMGKNMATKMFGKGK